MTFKGLQQKTTDLYPSRQHFQSDPMQQKTNFLICDTGAQNLSPVVLGFFI